MPDRKSEIINSYQMHIPESDVECISKEDAKDAMDEYMKECALELLDYVGQHVKWPIRDGASILFWDGNNYITREQLFENFL